MPDVLERLTTALEDRYRIERELGRGGMAIVYLAHDLKHHRQVALKVLRPDIAAALGAERFLREIGIAAGLNHPHILALHDSGEVDGLVYYVMPYVAGESLRQKLERQTQLSIEETIELARQVASALDYAHRQGVIHRDIKPENILLQEGEAVVADFGIARAVRVAGGERLTETGLSLGTPAYMSPEQASGDQKIDSRSDVYSLATVMYEMLAGEPPFTGPTTPAIVARQLVDPVPSIRTVRPTVPEELERVIEKALAKVPADRYDTAGAFVEAAGVAAQVEVVPAQERRVPHRRGSRKLWLVGVPVVLVSVVVMAGAILLLSSGWPGRGPPQLTVSNIRRVTHAPEIEIHPAVSPDGKEVVYSAESGIYMHLYVRDLGGGRSLALTADLPGTQILPRWTPDGRSIVFVELGRTPAESYLIPRFGGHPRKLASGLIWDVRGNRAVYTEAESIFVLSLDGGEPTRVASAPGIHFVTWSPDGSKLAYAQGNRESITTEELGNVAPSAIWIVDADGGDPVPVTDHPSLNVSPAWLPDGQHLLFISDRDGPRDIYAVRVDGAGRSRGEPVRVTTGLNPHTISVSADGSTVAYSGLTFRRNVWEIAIPETGSVSISEATPVTVGNQVVESLGLSSDGRWLGFDSNLDGNQDIYLMPVEGGEPRQVTRDPGDDFHPDFSPDGSEIVFYSNRHGSRDVFLISADGGNEARLTDDPGEDRHPSFSPDGLRIAFSRVAPEAEWERGEIYLMSRDAVGGEWSGPEQLTPINRSPDISQRQPRWSPDGSQIVYGYDVGNAIGIVSLEGQETVLLDGRAQGLAPVRQPEWSPDGRFVYFRGRDSSGTGGLYLIPAAGGTPREVIRFEDPTRDVYDYALGDGKVYLSVAEFESDIWVMDLEMK